MQLTVVIVNWNTRDVLESCLQSLVRHTRKPSFEVFVVDNASADGSSRMVAESFPGVRLIANDENVGYARANNQAIRLAKGDYIALLNPDTLLIEDVFSSLIETSETDRSIGVIGPRIVREDRVTIQHACARRLPTLFFSFCRLSGLHRAFPNTRLFGGEYMTYWDHRDSRSVESLLGACMMARRTALDEVGLLDENQFLYGDDIDWCKRFLMHGWRVYYSADTKVIHYGGRSSEQAVLRTGLASAETLRYYFRKHHGKTRAWSFCVLVMVISSLKYFWRSSSPQKSHNRSLAQYDKSLASWAVRRCLGRRDPVS